MARNDPDLPLVFARRDALTAGLSTGQVDRRATQQWSRLRRGWFTARDDLAAEMRWRAEMLAVVRAHRRPLVVSHASAARAHGWPSPLGGWGAPSFTTTDPPGRRRSGVWITVARLDGADVEVRGSVALTTRARTVVDCARRLAPHDALAIADAALREGVSHDALRLVLRHQARWPGVARAASVVELADGRRETAFESWSAWAFERQGLPRPMWQATVLDQEGVHIGRTDALWEEGVVGEADGRAKYRLKSLERRGIVDAEGLAQALDEERRRERGLVRTGARIVRWEPRDVLDLRCLRALTAHLWRVLAAASDERGFSGTVLLL